MLLLLTDMIINLPVHTSRYSRGCRILHPRDLIRRASKIELDGFAITEHNYLWGKEELKLLKRDAGIHDLLLLMGREISVEWSHLLIFNYSGRIRGNLLKDVVREVHEEGGIVILAHPFRFGRHLDRPPEELKLFFSLFDAVKVLTPKQSEKENATSHLLHEKLPFVGTRGSDGHAKEEVGQCVTEFAVPINNELELASAIRGNQCRPRF